MASSKEYLTFVLDQLTGLNGIDYRGMMGEYIGRIYICQNKAPQSVIRTKIGLDNFHKSIDCTTSNKTTL